MRMYTETNRALHRKMWAWLAKFPGRTKESFLCDKIVLRSNVDCEVISRHKGVLGYTDCFACVEATYEDKDIGEVRDCTKCPIKVWRDEAVQNAARAEEYKLPCVQRGSMYDRWREGDAVTRTKLALEIRDAWPRKAIK